MERFLKDNNRRSAAEVRIDADSDKGNLSLCLKCLSCEIAADTFGFISVLVQLARARPRARHSGHCLLLQMYSMCCLRVQVWLKRSPRPDPRKHQRARHGGHCILLDVSSVCICSWMWSVWGEFIGGLFVDLIDTGLRLTAERSYFAVIAVFNKIFHSVILIQS